MSWENFDSEIKRGNPQYGCKLCVLLEELPPSDAKGLQRALENPANSARGIHDALVGRGLRVGRESITKHREGRCQS